MKKNSLPEITTDRLLLRRLRQVDWEMISYLRSDTRVNEFLERPGAESKESALEFISETNNRIAKLSLYYWAITERNNNVMIGTICLWNFSNNRTSAEIGYDLSPRFQGKGFMNESLKCVLEFGFKVLRLESVEAYTHKNNESSKALLKKSGFMFIKDKKDEHNPDNVIFEIKNTSV